MEIIEKEMPGARRDIPKKSTYNIYMGRHKKSSNKSLRRTWNIRKNLKERNP